MGITHLEGNKDSGLKGRTSQDDDQTTGQKSGADLHNKQEAGPKGRVALDNSLDASRATLEDGQDKTERHRSS